MLTNRYIPSVDYLTDTMQDSTMSTDWNTAKKQIRKLGIRVTTSLKACTLGCCLDEHQISDDEKALWQSANRWNKHARSNVINHSGLDYAELFEICKILDDNNVIYRWRGFNYAIEIFF